MKSKGCPFAALAITAVFLAAAPVGKAPTTEEELATNPPPISLNINRATLYELADALAGASGTPIETTEMGGSGGGQFTLNVKDKPFWEILLALNSQESLQMISGQSFTFCSAGGIRGGIIEGGFYIYPYYSIQRQEADYQLPEGSRVNPEQIRLSIGMASDPRIRIAAMKPVRLLGATDDAGNILGSEEEADKPYGRGSGHHWGAVWTFNVPPKLGRKIASLKAEQTLLVAVGERSFEVPDIEKMSEPLRLTRQKLTVTGGTGGKPFTFKAQPLDPAAKGEFLAPLIIKLIDASGEQKWSGAMTDEINARPPHTIFEPLRYMPPLKMIVIEPKSLKEFRLRFELKDIPLPQ